MTIEGLSEEQIKNEVEFIMRLSAPIKKFLIENIFENFTEHEGRSRILFNFLGNFLCNVIHDMSEPQHVKGNIMEILGNITKWVNDTDEKMLVTYDVKNDRFINKGEMH